MSRYVNKPQGLMIGSGNIFFYHNEDEGHREFPAIVALRGLNFERITFFNHQVRSLANQFIYHPYTVDEVMEPFEVDGKLITDHVRQINRYALQPHLPHWLNENTPGWGFNGNHGDHPASIPPPLFFRTRKDALAFCAFVDEQLTMRPGGNWRQ